MYNIKLNFIPSKLNERIQTHLTPDSQDRQCLVQTTLLDLSRQTRGELVLMIRCNYTTLSKAAWPCKEMKEIEIK